MPLKAQNSRLPISRLPFKADSDLVVVIGLGNPGRQYDGTRHNVGYEVLKVLGKRYSLNFKQDKYLYSQISRLNINETDILLAMPQTFMNESGRAVRQIILKNNISLDSILVVHDELDLQPGTVKLKFGGGFAGHNGLKSIFDHCKSQDFARLRIGIGKPNRNGADYVLSKFDKSEEVDIRTSIEIAADATISIVEDGFEATQNRLN